MFYSGIVRQLYLFWSILFNQFGILYFNQVMEHTAFVPIVNTKGDVIGRSLAVDAIKKKINIIIIIRITLIVTANR